MSASSYLFADKQNIVPAHLAAKYEQDAARYWDAFYQRNRDKFYKDRHYFDREFPELCTEPGTLVEVGCGAGNTIFPLLDLNPQLKVYACDFASTAVEIVKAHPAHAAGKVRAFVCDIAQEGSLPANVPVGTADFVTMVFVLSAISPELMHTALDNVASVLRVPGGKVLFRDYAEGDLAQGRHQDNGVKKLGENYYVRGDGTRCVYFGDQQLRDLFGAHGFECVEMKMHTRDVENRKRGITMHRRWLQAVFRLKELTPGAARLVQRAGQRGAAPQGAGVDQQQGGGTSAHGSAGPQQQAQGSTTAQAELELPSPIVTGHTWLTGAAGRLASNLNAFPGKPSGRAMLPETLDSADELAVTVSPGASRRPTTDLLEARLEEEFFSTIERDTEDVVAEELAAAGLTGVELLDPLTLTTTRADPSVVVVSPAAAAGAVPAGAAPSPLRGGSAAAAQRPRAAHTTVSVPAGVSAPAPAQQAEQQQAAATAAAPLMVELQVLPGTRFLCQDHLAAAAERSAGAASCSGAAYMDPCSSSTAAVGASLMAARIISGCPWLVHNATVLELAAPAPGLASLTAVRCGARRVLATHPSQGPLAELGVGLHANAHRVVVERLRVAELPVRTLAQQQDASSVVVTGVTEAASSSSDAAWRQQYKLGATRCFGTAATSVLVKQAPSGFSLVVCANVQGALEVLACQHGAGPVEARLEAVLHAARAVCSPASAARLLAVVPEQLMEQVVAAGERCKWVHSVEESAAALQADVVKGMAVAGCTPLILHAA